jgi:hypothetical protein
MPSSKLRFAPTRGKTRPALTLGGAARAATGA